MPGSPEKEHREDLGHYDLDDIQTLKNLLELHSSTKKEKDSLDQPLD